MSEIISKLFAALRLWTRAALLKGARAIQHKTEGKASSAPSADARDDGAGELVASFDQMAAERMRLDAALREEVRAHKQAEQALHQALTKLQTLSEYMTRTQEEQRRAIAFELHEQSGQELSTLMIHLQILEAHCHGKAAQTQLQHARSIAVQALRRVRNMSLDLHPPQLEELGIYAALRAHCMQQAEAAGWSMHFDAPQTSERPYRDVEIACFRVVQEALTNVAQHALATEVWVHLRRDGSELQLNVRDNGLGFDAGRASEGGERAGFGLIVMAERVRQVAGQMEVRSNPGTGTEIQVRFFSQFRLI